MKTRTIRSRLGALLLALVMMVGMLPTSAFAGVFAAEPNPAPEYSFGPAGTSTEVKLIPGIYDLTVQMKKADNPAKDSMAADCIKGGALEVMNNGDAYVNIKLGAKSVGVISTYAKGWRIYQEHNIMSKAVPADVVTRDGKGNITEIRFKLPYTNQDGVFTNVDVEMGGMSAPMHPDALLKMLFHQAEHNSAKEAAKIDSMIAALGEISLASETAITEARSSYDWLVAESQALVQNLAVLEAAEAKLAQLKNTFKLAEGSYIVPIIALTSKAPLEPVAVAFSKGFGDTVQINVAADGSMTAVIVPQHMNIDLFGNIYQCNILKLRSTRGEAQYADITTQKYTDANDSQLYDIQAPGKMTVGMPAYDAAKMGYPLELTVDFMNTMYGNVAADNWMDVVLSLDLTKAEKLAGPFEIKATSMSLGNSLAMRFLFDEADLNGRTDVKAVITKEYADSREPVVVEVPYSQWTTKWNMSCVTFNGIAAKEMMDGVTFRIVAEDGAELSQAYTETVHNYALRQLKAANTDAGLKTVLVDMLNYGAEAQKEFKYDAGNLANADIDAYQQYATQNVTVENHAGRTHGTGYSASVLALNSNIRMTMFFKNITPEMHAVVTYVNHAGREVTLTIQGDQFRYKWDMYGVVIDELAVADVRTLVKCEIYDAQNNLVEGGVDSVESCAAREQNSEQSASYDALMKFGVSSAAYLNK